MVNQNTNLKMLGARILGEINDLKRTPEALAKELNWDLHDVQSVISGRASEVLSEKLIKAMTSFYPISLLNLWVELDDCNNGVKLNKSRDSLASTRTFNRPDKNGLLKPYYEYRDTAMSKLSPFKPEWIKPLRVVQNTKPDDMDVAYNIGHLLHQTTFVIGEVNFYWEISGKKYMEELNTGDSNYITPFVPHSFTSRNPKEPGTIIAITYSCSLHDGLDVFSRLNYSELESLTGDLRNISLARNALLLRHLAMESISKDTFLQKLTKLGISNKRAKQILAGEEACENELLICARVLNVNPRDLLLRELTEQEEVVISRKNHVNARRYPDTDRSTYLIRELARTLHQPYLKGFEITVTAACGEIIAHSLHEYVFNYGKSNIILKWGNNNSVVMEPGDSACIQPMIKHSFNKEPGGCNGDLIVIRVPGRLDEKCLEEYSGMAQGRSRVLMEKDRWF